MTLPRIVALRDSLRQQLASLRQGSTAHKVIRGKLYGVEECLALLEDEPKTLRPDQVAWLAKRRALAGV